MLPGIFIPNYIKKTFMTNKINVAVIGLGVGFKHALIYKKNKYCNLAIICEKNKKKIKKLKKYFPKVKFTINENDIFNNKSIKLVSIASYDNFHYQHVKKSIENNKHVMVEKPICLTEAELKNLISIFKKKKKLKISTNFTLRGSGIFNQIKNKISDFGKIYYIEASYNYGRIEKIIKGWRSTIPFYSVTHGGTIHLIDLIMWLTKKKIIKVISIGNKISTNKSKFRFKDCVSTLCLFEDGSTAKFNANFGCVTPHHHLVQIYGTKKTFIHNLENSFLYSNRDTDKKNKKVFKFNRNLFTYDKSKTLNDFIISIVKNKKINISKKNILDVMSVSIAIEKSLKTKKWEKVNYHEI